MAEEQKNQIAIGLLEVAAGAIAPFIGAYVGHAVGGPVGGGVGAAAGNAIGQGIENLVGKGLEVFIPKIAINWLPFFHSRTAEEQITIINEMANIPESVARATVTRIINANTTDGATDIDRSLAVEYLVSIPKSLESYLIPNPNGKGKTLPQILLPNDVDAISELLPRYSPPYATDTVLPGTKYVLLNILGMGGFGIVYKARHEDFKEKLFAIKICLQPELTASLRKEQKAIQHLKDASQDASWAAGIVMIEGYDLEHTTPYLVYEFIQGGDLLQVLTKRNQKYGRGLNSSETLILIKKIAIALQIAHQNGVVHRDLKPSNVLVSGNSVKLSDFGIGHVVAQRSIKSSLSGLHRSKSTQNSRFTAKDLFRGAGTVLYMSPEQKKGLEPEPTDDIYSLGVMWYQFLKGDFSVELPQDWYEELKDDYSVPEEHIAMIRGCVAGRKRRWNDAKTLLERLPITSNKVAPRERIVEVVLDHRMNLSLSIPSLGYQVQFFPVTLSLVNDFVNEHKPGFNPEKDKMIAQLVSESIQPQFDKPTHEVFSLFASRILPSEAVLFSEWYGGGYRLPTAEEWREIFQFLQKQNVKLLISPEVIEQSKTNPNNDIPFQRISDISCNSLLSKCFLVNGLLEWVYSKRTPTGFEGLGQPNQSLLPNTFSPFSLTDPPILPVTNERSDVFGFRLIR